MERATTLNPSLSPSVLSISRASLDWFERLSRSVNHHLARAYRTAQKYLPVEAPTRDANVREH